MSKTETSLFCQAALASGLLSEEQLEAARAELAKASPGGISDELLANQLIQQGELNLWQAEQLKAGRSKFNLGEYQIVDSIGQGGMGQVFLAEHGMMGRLCAVKVLPLEKSTPESINSFTREMRAIAQLDHENLVTAFHAGRDRNVYYLVTEYVPGADLRKLLKLRGQLGPREAATIIAQTAAGLQHAHQRGLIHRDVKPGNVLVTPEGKVKLSDLGLAGFTDEKLGADPRVGKIVGTADYIAPDLILTPHDVTSVSDIYSLGCTFYYAMTGKVPFPGGTTREKCHRHCNETPLHPRRFNPDLPEELLDTLADMMNKDPQQRIQTAAEVITRLAPWTDEKLAIKLQDQATEGYARPRLFSAEGQTSDGSGSMGGAVYAELVAKPHDSAGQASQGTVPIASAAHETATEIERNRPPLVKRSVSVPLAAIVAAGVAFLMVLVAVVVLLMAR